MVNLIELLIYSMKVAEDTPFLTQHFPNIFAEALVPFNPLRWQIIYRINSTSLVIPY